MGNGVWKDGTHDVIQATVANAVIKADEASAKAEEARILAVTNNQKIDALFVAHMQATPTYKILEATDSDEYMALDANKKHWYDLFISAGTLDMSDGTKANDLFLAWLFPPGKLTHAALLAILS